MKARDAMGIQCHAPAADEERGQWQRAMAASSEQWE